MYVYVCVRLYVCACVYESVQSLCTTVSVSQLALIGCLRIKKCQCLYVYESHRDL